MAQENTDVRERSQKWESPKYREEKGGRGLVALLREILAREHLKSNVDLKCSAFKSTPYDPQTFNKHSAALSKIPFTFTIKGVIKKKGP